MMGPELELRGVGFGYGARQVLRGIDLKAGAGEFCAIAGANGAGKSTLLDLISGLRVAGAGSIRVDGRERGEWTAGELARRVSHLPQAVGAELPFTAEQVVGMGRYPHTDGWFESEEDRRVMRRVMERTGCWEWRSRGFASLSGGERQRVLLAACLAQDAGILLLDEPSTYMDIDQQLACFTLLREEARAGKLCVVVTHDLNLALTFCTRVVVLRDGVVAKEIYPREGDEGEWLGMFSPRLRMGRTEDGSPWVWYR